MTDHNALFHDQAADLVRNDPALAAGSEDEQENNEGTDDDATTPDQAVTEQD